MLQREITGSPERIIDVLPVLQHFKTPCLDVKIIRSPRQGTPSRDWDVDWTVETFRENWGNLWRSMIVKVWFVGRWVVSKWWSQVFVFEIFVKITSFRWWSHFFELDCDELDWTTAVQRPTSRVELPKNELPYHTTQPRVILMFNHSGKHADGSTVTQFQSFMIWQATTTLSPSFLVALPAVQSFTDHKSKPSDKKQNSDSVEPHLTHVDTNTDCLERPYNMIHMTYSNNYNDTFSVIEILIASPTPVRPSYVVNCQRVGNSPIIPSPPWRFLLVKVASQASPIDDWNLMWDITPFSADFQYDHMRYSWYKLCMHAVCNILSWLGFVDWLRSQVWAMHRHPTQLELKWIKIIPKNEHALPLQNWRNTLHVKLLTCWNSHIFLGIKLNCVFGNSSHHRKHLGNILEHAKALTFNFEMFFPNASITLWWTHLYYITGCDCVNSIASRRRIPKVTELINIQKSKLDSEMLQNKHHSKFP